MRSLFPGMDPYLEDPIFWSSFHNRFLVAIAEIPMKQNGGVSCPVDPISSNLICSALATPGFTLRDRIPTFSLPLQEPDENLDPGITKSLKSPIVNPTHLSDVTL